MRLTDQTNKFKTETKNFFYETKYSATKIGPRHLFL